MKLQPAILALGLFFSAHAWAGGTEIADFGNVLDNTQMSLDYTITNTGPGVITMTNFAISGIGFSAVEDGCESIPVNGTCQVEITFWPLMPGFDTGYLALQFNNDELDWELQGSGIQ